MGCGSSKADESELVVLCRERRDLIRAAGEYRYALASAHTAYFRSLRGIGEALQQFAQEELSVASSEGPSSPVLTIPSSEGKGESRSRSVLGAAAGGGGSSGSTPRSSLSHSLSHDEDSHLHLSEDSHLHLSSEEEKEEDEVSGGGRGEVGGEGPYYPYSVPGHPNYYYMKHSSTTPSMVYQSPYPGYGYQYPSYGGNDGYYGASMSAAPPSGDASPSSYYYYGQPMSAPRPPSPPPPPPPPPPPSGGSAWDFLDPFGTYEQVYSSYRMGSTASSPNSSEVREKEGIPDLEDETEQEVIKEVKKEKVKKMDDGSSSQKDPGKGSTSKASPAQEKDVSQHSLDEKQSKGSPECIASNSSGEARKSKSSGEEDDSVRKKRVTFEMETSLETEKSGPSIGAALTTQGTRDVREVVELIREQFMVAEVSGEELSAMLEVGKLRYRSRKIVLRVLSSRILYYLPMMAYSCPSFKRPRPLATRTRKMAKASRRDYAKYTGMKSGDLSSTLEKLYMWEEKLYKEVKFFNRLRISYDKKFKKLKILDDRGAEAQKIDGTRTSIRKLVTKIEVTIKSINSISTRIQKLRDVELPPQLIQLIHGLRKMWNSVLDCHQKQYQAIVDSKTCNLMAKTGLQGNYGTKATKQLEVELLNWSSCFSDWISTQKAYVEALNGWLFTYLDVEPEVTPDGVVPFSPGRIGAPAIFIICHDWYQAMSGNSEGDVEATLNNFAAIVHKLWETQDEEQRQKLKVDYISKDFTKRLGYLQREGGMHLHIDPLNLKVVPSENGGGLPDDRMVALDEMRKRWEEEKTKHAEIVKQVHEAASSSLREGLIPIFQALGSFTLEKLKAFEEVRVLRT